VDAHPDGKPDAFFLFQAWIECLHRGNGPESHPHGALRIVFVRQWIAKVDQQAIAKVLGNVPLEALDHRGTRGLIGPHDRAVVLRVEPSGQSGGAHQVTEHHREMAALCVGNR
jgi:hypothetical protein